MTTLMINGRKVQVDDSFLSMSPEQQNATVDEIAASLGGNQSQQAAPEPAPKTAEKPQEGNDALSMGRTVSGGLIEGIPVLGPLLRRGTEKAAAATYAAFDPNVDYEEALRRVDMANQQEKAANPVLDVGSQIVGGVASMAPVAATATGARLMGMTGPSLAARAGMSAASGAAVSGADTIARGGDGTEALGSAGIGGAIGGAIPVLGAGLSAVGRAAGEQLQPLVGAIRNPAKEANRRVGVALQRDFAGGAQNLMSSADEAVARQAGIPVLNADRGGETTRALARSVANQSPEARAAIENVASDRFGTQSTRAMDFIKRIAGGNADDLAYQETLKRNARLANKPAYDAAFKSPQARQVFTPKIQDLMQSPSFRQAVDAVPRRSADRAAVEGFKEIGNPFTKNSQGAYVLSRKSDGTLVTPSLEFWNQVKINLDDKISTARRAGKNALAADMTALKQSLVDELDQIVPTYKTARAGAAAFFGAEDALDAGRKFATQPRMVPEAQRALQAMKKAEKEAFATGYASELIDRIRSSGDRTNVINSVFKNQSARDSMALVFGPQKAKEIEAYVRVEDLVDRIRGSLGNSTTARQLVEMGLGAGGGYAFTGDLQGAAMGAALTRGVRFAGQRADAKVMEQMAKLLTSPNRGNLAIAVKQAAAQPQYMIALEKLGAALAVPARAAGVMAAGSAAQ
jgi:hypothetical protein